MELGLYKSCNYFTGQIITNKTESKLEMVTIALYFNPVLFTSSSSLSSNATPRDDWLWLWELYLEKEAEDDDGLLGRNKIQIRYGQRGKYRINL